MMKVLRLAALSLLSFFLANLTVAADEPVPSSQDIVDALLPTGLDGRKIKGARSLDGLLGGKDSSANNRGVKVLQGKEVPFIDLRVAFEYDSDRLSNDAMLTLQRLGEALSSEALKASQFRIIGHTDAKGSVEYNDDLSRRRALAVVKFLLVRYQFDTDRLKVDAKGKSEPLPDIPPEDERNRRVEIQNIGNTPTD